MTDKEIKELLERILKLDKISEAKDVAVLLRNEARSEMSSLQTKVASIQKHVESMDDMYAAALQRHNSAKEDYSKRKQELQAEISQLTEKLDPLTLENIEDLDKEKNAIQEKLVSLETAKDDINSKLSSLEDKNKDLQITWMSKISAATDKLDSLNKKISKIHKLDTCPTCLQVVTEEHVASVEAELGSQIASLEKDLASYKGNLDTLTQKYTKKKESILEELIAAKELIQETKHALGTIQSKLHDQQKIKLQRINIETKLNSLQLQQAVLDDKVNMNQENVDEILDKKKQFEKGLNGT
jgi:DNA repair exonuclease SbcCD ATPase subunit